MDNEMRKTAMLERKIKEQEKEVANHVSHRACFQGQVDMLRS